MKSYDVTRLPSMITLGYDGENNWRPNSFDCSSLLANHPNGTISLWLLPHGETQAFPVALTRDGNSVVWTPLSEEMTAATGAFQIVCTDGTDVGKSAVVMFRVDESILPGADHPAAVPSWATQAIERAEAAADRAEEAAESIDVEHLEQIIAAAVEAYLIEHPIESPVQSVNGKTGAVVLDAEDVGALPADTPLPAAVAEQTVAGWGFTKNTGTYSKPSGGIPASDLAPAVQTSLGKADTALQQHQSLSGYATETWVQNQGYGTYSKPGGGIPTSDLNLVDLGNWLDDAGANIYTLSLSGTTVTLNKSWLIVYSSLIGSARQNLFILPIGGTTQNPVVLILSLQKADAQNYTITLACVYNGNRYSVTLSAASANASPMTGTLVVEPLAELPTVTASDNGKFLRVVSGAWAAETVQTWQGGSY